MEGKERQRGRERGKEKGGVMKERREVCGGKGNERKGLEKYPVLGVIITGLVQH